MKHFTYATYHKLKIQLHTKRLYFSEICKLQNSRANIALMSAQSIKPDEFYESRVLQVATKNDFYGGQILYAVFEIEFLNFFQWVFSIWTF